MGSSITIILDKNATGPTPADFCLKTAAVNFRESVCVQVSENDAPVRTGRREMSAITRKCRDDSQDRPRAPTRPRRKPESI